MSAWTSSTLFLRLPFFSSLSSSFDIWSMIAIDFLGVAIQFLNFYPDTRSHVTSYEGLSKTRREDLLV